MSKAKQNQRISFTKKNANKKAWYKEQADMLDVEHSDINYGHGDVSESRRMKVNYDLFNNILDLSDFEYVCKPFGAEAGELPAKMVNRDIVSAKVKAVLGMEMKRPFSYKVVATNPEATSRREQAQFEKMKEFVIGEIMTPIKQEIEIKYQQQSQGQELTPEQVQEIQQKIQQETKSQTPEEVKEYMERDYQDPSEIMSHQLLQYLTQKCDLKRKFNDALKHGLLSAKGIMYVGILNGEPEAWNVNSLRFRCDKSPDTPFIEDGEWATVSYPMVPSEIIKYFGDELTQDEIDTIYASWAGNRKDLDEEDFFQISELQNSFDDNSTIPVVHCVWKSLRKIGFLYYLDENDKEQMMIVDEKYKINTDAGDLKIDWEWIPEVYETWKIKASDSIYVNMRPIPGQFKDLNNLYHCKLPYYGVIYDNMNSQETSLMDRLKVYQYYYNIVMYRLELLLASDKGKKVLMNINMIPDSAGIDIEKWQYFMESTPYMWYDPNEEGKTYADASTVAKVLDLSLISDIQKYIEIAEYLRQQCGRSVGITDQVEGQIGPRESVGNTQQSLAQTSNLLEPYFNLHDHLKKNVLQALVEMGKIAYSGEAEKKLPYVLDDMSIEILNLDMGMLDGATLGLFVADSGQAQDVLDNLKQLSHAAMQNQKIELSDVISTLKKDNLADAEAGLKAAETERFEREQAANQANLKAQAEEAEKIRQREREKHEEEKELVVLKEEERRKTVIQQAALMGASFNPDADEDNDGKNDFVELAQKGVENNMKVNEQQLNREKFEHQKQTDKKKLAQADEKLKSDKSKNSKK